MWQKYCDWLSIKPKVCESLVEHFSLLLELESVFDSSFNLSWEKSVATVDLFFMKVNEKVFYWIVVLIYAFIGILFYKCLITDWDNLVIMFFFVFNKIKIKINFYE